MEDNGTEVKAFVENVTQWNSIVMLPELQDRTDVTPFIIGGLVVLFLAVLKGKRHDSNKLP